MGVYLQNPIKDKCTTNGQIGKLQYAASCMQGWRTSMEDEHITELNFNGQQNLHLFAIFDGHGGKEVAEYCRDNFGTFLKADENFKSKKFDLALINIFKKLDVCLFFILQYQRINQKKKIKIVHEFQDVLPMQFSSEKVNSYFNQKLDQIYVANVGDSRSILSKKNGTVQALSIDHKPESVIEKQRVYAAGGQIFAGRINGNLNLSRAVGDLEYKEKKLLPHDKQLIISVPDIVNKLIVKCNQQKIIKTDQTDEFILMGCDGVFEMFSNEELAKKVQTFNRQNSTNLKQTVEQLLDSIIAPNTYSFANLNQFYFRWEWL